MKSGSQPPFDPTAGAHGGYSGRQNLLRLILIISVIALGYVVWQAVQYSQSTPAPKTVVQQPTTTTNANTGDKSLDQLNQRLQQDLTRSQQASQSLKQAAADNERRTKAVFWWFGTAVLIFHILNVVRLLRKLAKAYATGQANYARHHQLQK